MGQNLHWTQQQYDDYLRRHNLPQRNSDSSPVVESPPPLKPKGRQPNKTESEFGLILEAQKRRGEIIFFAYEGVSLRWGDGMRYTADWVVFADDKPITLVEVKGAYIWPKDMIRFKGCMSCWKVHFDFQMWQKKSGEWRRIY